MKPDSDIKKKNAKKNTKTHPHKKTGQKSRDKEQRRAEHEARATAWAALTPEGQLSALDSRCQRAVRQRQRIVSKAGGVAWDSGRRVIV